MELVQPHIQVHTMSVHNKGHLQGRIVSDIITRHPSGGLDVTEFRVKPMGSKDGVSPIPVTAYNGVGNNISTSFNKGDNIALETFIQYKTWTDKTDGSPRGRHEVVATYSSYVDGGFGKISRELREIAEASKVEDAQLDSQS